MVVSMYQSQWLVVGQYLLSVGMGLVNLPLFMHLSPNFRAETLFTYLALGQTLSIRKVLA